MDAFHRSLSVDTLSNYVAQANISSSLPEEATTTPSKADFSVPTQLKQPLPPHHILLSVTLNVTQTPVLFTAEEIPIKTPDYVHEVKACSEADLYFLRWVFEANFQVLTDYISTHYSDYKILRAEAEPGVDWADFREGRRGFLVWLVTHPDNPDPIAALQTLLRKSTSADDNANVNARDKILAKLVGSHLSIFRRQLQSFHKAMDESEAEIAQIWEIVSSSGIVKKEDLYVGDLDKPVIPEIPSVAPPKIKRHVVGEVAGGPNAENVSEWSVVDEYEERELTSLSGYETTSDGEIN
ncbi:hypothetical protein D0Z03_002707 [Geotrichum reessii]|nr:hypothetical protein D0Z03_002707 [Galactomyces reessii]